MSSLPQVGGMEEKDPSEMTYRSLLGKMMEINSKPLVDAYGAIEGLLEQVDSYVKVNSKINIIYLFWR